MNRKSNAKIRLDAMITVLDAALGLGPKDKLIQFFDILDAIGEFITASVVLLAAVLGIALIIYGWYLCF